MTKMQLLALVPLMSFLSFFRPQIKSPMSQVPSRRSRKLSAFSRFKLTLNRLILKIKHIINIQEERTLNQHKTKFFGTKNRLATCDLRPATFFRSEKIPFRLSDHHHKAGNQGQDDVDGLKFFS